MHDVPGLQISIQSPPFRSSQVTLLVKNLPVNAGDARDTDLIPESRRSPGVGNGKPLQFHGQESLVGGGGSQRVESNWTHTHTHKHIDPRLVGTGRLKILSPIYLTINQSEESLWPVTPSLNQYSKTSHYPLYTGTHSFEGISSSWLPLPGKPIKQFFSISPMRCNLMSEYKGQIWLHFYELLGPLSAPLALSAAQES